MHNDPFDRGKYRRPMNRLRFVRVPKPGLSKERIAQLVEQSNLEDFLLLCAPCTGIKLRKILPQDIPAIEVFFDVYRSRRKVGYILKQWNSPMVRLGTNIKLRKDLPDLADRFREIHHLCSVHFISLLFPPTAPQNAVMPISLETAINHDGINLVVFREALCRFATCLERLEPLLKAG
jgi:hypothetical protein